MPRLTSKGQVTVPRHVREALGIGPGSDVEFDLGPDGAVLRKRAPTAALDRWQGRLHGRLPAGSVDELMETFRGDRHPGDGAP